MATIRFSPDGAIPAIVRQSRIRNKNGEYVIRCYSLDGRHIKSCDYRTTSLGDASRQVIAMRAQIGLWRHIEKLPQPVGPGGDPAICIVMDSLQKDHKEKT